MKGSCRPLALVVVATALAMLAGCPLPFQYNGKGASNAPASDPSSPNMTLPVTVSYTDAGGASGTVADGGTVASGQTTTVTLTTTSLNAVIFYTTDGTALTNLRTAQKVNSSTVSFTVTRQTVPVTLDVHAIAVGPNMLPSPPVHVTVSVSPYPILSISRNNASISENGGTASFTITASTAPASSVTVSLVTGGSYAAAEVTGLPASGTTFAATLAAGTTTVAVPITANHDANGVNETVSVTINPDPANPSTYTVGSPASASLTILDDATPALSLAEDRSFMTDGQSATFTVGASFPPPSNLTVNLASSGYDPGTVVVPATVVLPAGATSVTFPVFAPSIGGYLEQAPLVSIAAGTGYTVGSPSAESLIVTALGYPFTGLWNFSTGSVSSSVGGSPWSLTGNVPLVNGSLSFSGNYPNDYASTDVTPIMNQNLFTVGVGFNMTDVGSNHVIIVGGFGYRWMMLETSPGGALTLVLNNHSVNYPLPFTVTPGTDHVILLSMDLVSETATVRFDGVQFVVPTPGFTWNNPPGTDLTLTSDDFSTGNAFPGLWHWVYLANGVL
jgi:Chitobiase/beta-hexosaminidase C-terminal domain